MVSEDDQVAQLVAELSLAGAPLEQGLLAAAEESPGTRTARSLRQLASELSAGKSLEDSLARHGNSTSTFVRAAIAAGLASPEFASVLVELTALENDRRELLGRLKQNLIYPVLLIIMTSVTVLFAFGYLVPAIDVASSEFPDYSGSLGSTTRCWLVGPPRVAIFPLDQRRAAIGHHRDANVGGTRSVGVGSSVPSRSSALSGNGPQSGSWPRACGCCSLAMWSYRRLYGSWGKNYRIGTWPMWHCGWQRAAKRGGRCPSNCRAPPEFRRRLRPLSVGEKSNKNYQRRWSWRPAFSVKGFG